MWHISDVITHSEAVVKQLHASQHMQGSAFLSRHEHQFGGATSEHRLRCQQVAPISHHQQHVIEQKHQRQLADSEKRAEGSEAAHEETKVCQPTEHWSVLHACDHLPPCCCVVPYSE